MVSLLNAELLSRKVIDEVSTYHLTFTAVFSFILSTTIHFLYYTIHKLLLQVQVLDVKKNKERYLFWLQKKVIENKR